jgi:hypothetical protein
LLTLSIFIFVKTLVAHALTIALQINKLPLALP